MRRMRRSTLAAFGLGLFWATSGTAAIIGLHHVLAPPGPDLATAEKDGTTVGNLARWTRQALMLGDEVQTTTIEKTSIAPHPAPVAPEIALQAAQTQAVRHLSDADAQRVLTRSIQQELRRVGCYAGSVDGTWSDATRSAMMAFNEALNVKLPSSAPDYILLTMVQGYPGRACGRPSGGTVASAPQRGDRVGASQAKQAPQQIVTAQPQAQAGWSAAVTPAPAPSQTATAPALQPEFRSSPATEPPAAPVVTAVPAAPLPGRMAIGAPASSPSLPQVDHALRTTSAPLPADQPIGLAPPPARPQFSPSQQRQPSAQAAARRESNGGGGSQRASDGGGSSGSGSNSSTNRSGSAFATLGRNAP